jgi:hypothetical protein
MAHGGARLGAGRKKGQPNKATQRQRDAVIASGLTPLDYLLSVMRDSTQPDAMRLDAAGRAAPYVHPRLSTVEMKGRMEVSHEERLRRLK